MKIKIIRSPSSVPDKCQDGLISLYAILQVNSLVYCIFEKGEKIKVEAQDLLVKHF